jgi:hypothetical protein
MVTEVARFTAEPGRETEFRTAVQQGLKVIQRQPESAYWTVHGPWAGRYRPFGLRPDARAHHPSIAWCARQLARDV